MKGYACIKILDWFMLPKVGSMKNIDNIGTNKKYE